MVKITEVKTKEGKKHRQAKEKIFKRLADNNLVFVNEFGKEYDPSNSWENLFMGVLCLQKCCKK